MPANQPVPEVWDSLASFPSQNAWAAFVVLLLWLAGMCHCLNLEHGLTFKKSPISRIKYLFWEVNPPGFGFSVRVKQENKLNGVLRATLDVPGGISRKFGVRGRHTVRNWYNWCFSSHSRGSAEVSQNLWDLTQELATSWRFPWLFLQRSSMTFHYTHFFSALPYYETQSLHKFCFV